MSRSCNSTGIKGITIFFHWQLRKEVAFFDRSFWYVTTNRMGKDRRILKYFSEFLFCELLLLCHSFLLLWFEFSFCIILEIVTKASTMLIWEESTLTFLETLCENITNHAILNQTLLKMYWVLESVYRLQKIPGSCEFFWVMKNIN